MPAVDPYNAQIERGVGNPDRWVAVTPSASAYIEGDASNHNVAVGLYIGDTGYVTYWDTINSTEQEIYCVAGTMLPGKFIRVTDSSGSGTKSTIIYAAMIGDIVS